MNHQALIVIIVGLATVAKLSTSFNLDASISTVLPNPDSNSARRGTYFGYTVALHVAGNTAWAFVGAPRANGSTGGVAEEGALYRCSVSGSNSCQRVPISGGGPIDPNYNYYKELKDYNWLGGSLDVSTDDKDAVIATCRHRWQYELTYDRSNRFMNGACYWASLADLTATNNMDPEKWHRVISLIKLENQVVVDPITGNNVFYYQFGQLGTSAHLLNSSQGLLMGAPGVYKGQGTLATLKPHDSFGPIDSRRRRAAPNNWVSLVEDVVTPIPQGEFDDYSGYSVTSGRFWGGEDSYVSTAPRSNHVGKVYVMSSESVVTPGTQIEWVGSGPRMGSGYGMSVAAGDVTGDGVWDELFVGAPLLGKFEAWEAGAVFVYSPDKTFGSMRLVAQLEGRGTGGLGGERFGAALSVVGDLDRDGYNDLAVGAPYEDGVGVLYIYRGSSEGLILTPSQIIPAHDVNTGLRGFGSSISRGADVDGNGYLDVAVGAHEGEGAVAVLRSRKVMVVNMEVESSVELLAEAGATFTVQACGRYQGHNLDQQKVFVIEGLIDGGIDLRATFVTTSGTGQVNAEVTARKNQRKCMEYPIKLKTTIAELQTPLAITFSAQMKTPDSDIVESPDSRPSMTLELPLALGCGSDGVCSPQLYISANWIDGSDCTHMLGSDSLLRIRVRVEAKGDAAYMSKVKVTPPPGFAPFNPPYTCDIISGKELDCMLKNPLHNDQEELYISLVEVGGGGGLKEGEAHIQLTAEARGAESVSVFMKFTIEKDVRLSLRGYTSDDYFYYNPNVTAPSAEGGIIIQAENRGVSRTDGAVMTLEYPAELTMADGQVLPFADVEFSFGSETCERTEPEEILKSYGNVGIENVMKYDDADYIARCGHEDVQCTKVRCHLGQLPTPTTLDFIFKFNVTGIVDHYSPNITIAAQIRGVITSQDFPQGHSIDVWALVVPEGFLPPIPPRPTPAWVYVVGILVGLAILAVMVAGLWKLGFFKRKQHEMANKSKNKGGGEGEEEVGGEADREDVELAPLTGRGGDDEATTGQTDQSVSGQEDESLNGQINEPLSG